MRQIFSSFILLVLLSGIVLAQQDVPTLSINSTINRISAPEAILYEQVAGAGTSSLTSQNFEAAYDIYDNQGADDFIVPSGQTWSIESLDILGAYYNGLGPAVSFNVFFYNNAANLPGTLVTQVLNVGYTDPSGLGSPTITLSPPVVLSAGSYWLSVQCNMDFAVGGQWGWREHLPIATESAWQNPGGGFATPCTTWGYRVTNCNVVGTAGYTDFAFRINGTPVSASLGLMLIADGVAGTDSVEAWLNVLGETYTRFTNTAALALPTSTWLTYDAVLYIGSTNATAERDSCQAYCAGGGNLLVWDNDEGYYTYSSLFFQNYLMSLYQTDAGSDGTITGLELMQGLSLNISADPYPDDVLPNAGPYGTGVPIFLAPTTTTYAGMRGNGGTFRTQLLCWDPNNGDSRATNILILSRTVAWLVDGIIPVELTSFSANVDQNIVTLNWETATEINNQGFEIERNSGNGFVKVGFVPGFGTTTEPRSYSFTDAGLTEGVYSYRLKQVDYNGMFEYSKIVEAEIVLPNVYSLSQNYPNPFNPNTKITFSLAIDSKVSLKVFDVLGQEVMTLVNGNIIAGSHQVDFQASTLNSGVYFYRLEATGADGTKFTDVKKMILTK